MSGQPPSALMTIGTDDAWAPPKLVRLQLADDLTITNVDEVLWDVSDRARITRAAFQHNGEWFALAIGDGIPVRAGQPVGFQAGALRITQHFDDRVVLHEQPQIAGTRGLLGKGRGLLGKGRA